MKKCFILFSFALFSTTFAQIDPVKYSTYTDIEAALQSKETVFSMSFRDKGLFNLPPQISKLNSIFF
jgi:hypothetical protein